MKRLRNISPVLFWMLGATLFLFARVSNSTTPPEQEAAAKAVNVFAIDLYRRLPKAERNLFFSPYSISMCLAMAYTGARGKTASQMASALHFDSNQEKLNKSFRALNGQVLAAGKGKAAELNIANALWAEKSFPFREEFLEAIRIHYAQSGGWFSQVPMGSPTNAFYRDE